MLTLLKRSLYGLTNKILGGASRPKAVEEKWAADFSSPETSGFDVKSDSSYDAWVDSIKPQSVKKVPGLLRQNERETGALVLGLKKANCIAWLDAPEHIYQDQVIEARFSLDNMGGYAAAGIMFRIIEAGTYYLALISSKGFFRLDAVQNNTPMPLVGWTEVPGFAKPEEGEALDINLEIIAYGECLIFLVNGRWAAEIEDDVISAGRPGFVLASYEAGSMRDTYTCLARLEHISVDSRIDVVSSHCRKWKNSPEIMAENRLHLAETFAAMGDSPGNASHALNQIRRAWERREEAIASVWATYTETRSRKELLLAARMAFLLGQYDDADEYIDACLEQGMDTPEGKEALTEKAKILLAEKKYGQMKDFVIQHLSLSLENASVSAALFSFLGHAHWNLQEYTEAAAAWDKAFEFDPTDGMYAFYAANAYEALGRRFRTLKRSLAAGSVFLSQDNFAALGELIDKLDTLGPHNWQARALTGKWAFSVGDFDRAETELTLSDRFRRRARSKPPVDPEVCFLRGLLLIRKGRRQEASAFLEEAVVAEPTNGLFHFRLAENRYLLTGNANDSQLTKELAAALERLPNDGWVHNLAAQICLAKDNLDAAEAHLAEATRTLGEVPVVRMNRAEFFYRKNSLDEALQMLDADARDDPEGTMANYAGDLLVRADDLDRADAYYRKAVSIAPQNAEYISNRAACLIKLGLLGQAEEMLERAPKSPEVFEMISYAASKKSEFARAEEASLAALEMEPDYLPSLLSLGWIYCNTSRWAKLEKILPRLEARELSGSQAEQRNEMRKRFEAGMFRTVSCTTCKRKWKLRREEEAVPALRIHAMPPDDFPAGVCPECGKAYCIGCAKKDVDKNGRFTCPHCKSNLKLSDAGLKKMIYDWATQNIPNANQ